MMTERAILECVTEYVVNCAWQVPLLAGGAWLLVKAVRPGILAQHWLWLSVLAMAVVLPLRGLGVWPTVQPAARSGETRDPGVPSNANAGSEASRKTPKVEFISVQRGGYDRAVKARSLEAVALRVNGRSLMLSVAATRWFVGIYTLSLLAGGLRLVRGLRATRRLVRNSREPILAQRTTRLLEDSCSRLCVAMPWVRESVETTGPVIVGALRPVMVLPLQFQEHAEEEVQAALLHELAHVRRRDYLVNLICQTAALPVVWHPAAHGIQQRIRRTREMLCDGIAAEEMRSGTEYAQCLVSLARRILRDTTGTGTQALGLFERNTMEERVMKLTEAKVVRSGPARTLRAISGCAVMAAVICAAAIFHVRPTVAAAETVAQSAAAPGPVAAVPAKPSAQIPSSAAAPQAITRGKHAEFAAHDGDYVHHWKSTDGEAFAMVNQDAEEPSAEEREKVERQAADSVKKANEAMARVNGPEFQAKMAELQKKLNSKKIKAEIEAATKLANDPAMSFRMEKLEQELSHLDSIRELKKFEDPEWQKQFAELQTNLPKIDFQFDFDKQMADLHTTIDDEKLNDSIAKGMKGNAEQMAKLQKELTTADLKAKLDAATKLLDEVKTKMEKMQAK